jgi:hypothetical protein
VKHSLVPNLITAFFTPDWPSHKVWCDSGMLELDICIQCPNILITWIRVNHPFLSVEGKLIWLVLCDPKAIDSLDIDSWLATVRKEVTHIIASLAIKWLIKSAVI